MVTIGGVVSSTTLTLAVPLAPPVPGAVKVPLSIVADTPLTVIGALGSSTVPLTVMDLLAKSASGAGSVIASFGPCSVAEIVVVEVLPATSMACTESARVPLVVWTVQLKSDVEKDAATPLQVTEASPEPLSLTRPVTEMLTVGLTDPSVGEVIASSGAVWSTLIVMLSVALAPEESVAVPLNTWFAPSVETGIDAGHVIGGMPPSHWKLTVACVLIQPAVLGVGETLAFTVSGGLVC